MNWIASTSCGLHLGQLSRCQRPPPPRSFQLRGFGPHKRALLKVHTSKMVGKLFNIKPGDKGKDKIKKKQPSDTLVLPVHQYQLLGLPCGVEASRDTVLAAFEALEEMPLEDGYSAAAVTGKQKMLERVLKDVEDGEAEAPSADGLPPGLEVSTHMIPGALALLEQVAEYDLVTTLGEKSLETQDTNAGKTDILLAMGLAKLGKADDFFHSENQAAAACMALQEGVLYLKSTGDPPAVQPGMIEEIEEYLESIAPQAVIDQLELPLLLEHEKNRVTAIKILKELMAAPVEAKNPFLNQDVDRHFVKQALDLMTSQEVVSLMNWKEVLSAPKSYPWFYPGIVQKFSVAHILVAFVHRRPTLLEDLQQILAFAGKVREADVEQVVCNVLLGETMAALDFIETIVKDSEELTPILDESDEDNGLPPVKKAETGKESTTAVGAKYLPGRNQIFQYITAKSDQSNDETLLSGLLVFTSRWISKSAFDQFRDTAERTNQGLLEDYFGDKRVLECLQKRGLCNPFTPKAREMASLRLVEKEEQADPLIVDFEESETEPAENPAVSKKKPLSVPRKKRTVSVHPYKKPNPIAVAISGGALLGAGLFAYIYQPWVNDNSLTLTEAQQAAVKRLNVLSPISTTLAETVVKKWQYAKGAALGPQHETKYLGKILTSDLLDFWRSRVADVIDQNLHWKYNVYKCNVLDVDGSQFDEGLGHVDIYAELGEVATMHDGTGRMIDKYKTSYKVRYEVVLDPEGKWKIQNIDIIKT